MQEMLKFLLLSGFLKGYLTIADFTTYVEAKIYSNKTKARWKEMEACCHKNLHII